VFNVPEVEYHNCTQIQPFFSSLLGPYGASTELGVFHNYSTGISDYYGNPPQFQVAGEFAPNLHGAASIAGQITLYRSKH